VRCGIISSSQSDATSEIVETFLATSLSTVKSAIANTGLYLFAFNCSNDHTPYDVHLYFANIVISNCNDKKQDYKKLRQNYSSRKQYKIMNIHSGHGFCTPFVFELRARTNRRADGRTDGQDARPAMRPIGRQHKRQERISPSRTIRLTGRR